MSVLKIRTNNKITKIIKIELITAIYIYNKKNRDTARFVHALCFSNKRLFCDDLIQAC